MKLGILACVAMLVLAGCTNHQVRPYGESFPPTLPGEVQVLYSPPDREHIKIGSVDVRYHRPGFTDPTVYQAAERIQEAGAQLGAHAVVVISSASAGDRVIRVTGEAIRFPDRS